MTEVRRRPCNACPYRRDVPSGVWAREEYEKLRLYDTETWAQPTRGFSCHASPDEYCHGWAVVHSNRGGSHDLLALRLDWPGDGIPEPTVELFSSGTEAADHGQRDIDAPSVDAVRSIERLIRKHPWIYE